MENMLQNSLLPAYGKSDFDFYDRKWSGGFEWLGFSKLENPAPPHVFRKKWSWEMSTLLLYSKMSEARSFTTNVEKKSRQFCETTCTFSKVQRRAVYIEFWTVAKMGKSLQNSLLPAVGSSDLNFNDCNRCIWFEWVFLRDYKEIEEDSLRRGNRT